MNLLFRNCSRFTIPLSFHHRYFSQITVQSSDSVKNVILSKPETRNALSHTMLKELKEAVLHNDPNTRCLILRAEGNVFSSGHNLKELAASNEEERRDIFKSCSELMMGISHLPIPVIAQVNGVAAAAGCQLVASCDIVVASEKSSFSTPGANFGIFCSTPGIALVRNVPMKCAADMLYTGLPISAMEALQSGLVSAVVPESDLEKETSKRVEAICAKSRSVVALGKRFLQKQINMTVDEAYRCGESVMVENIGMEDGLEGIKSFIEKRRPVWSHND